MSDLGSFVKRLRDIMRNDAGINGDAQRIEQIAWMLFLKVYDAQEENWEFDEDDYKSIIPENCRWRNWAHEEKTADGKATGKTESGESLLTGDELLNFVNNTLFPSLKNLQVDSSTPIRKSIVRATFEDANQYMKDGVLLRQILDVVDGVDFGDYEESHAFGDIYESILKELQSAGSAGEFYTPRAVTDFMAEMIQPKIGERMADFAAGTGGFIVSWLKQLEKQIKTTSDEEAVSKSIYGIEKKQFPYMLCVTNLLLHGVDDPCVYHDNSLLKDVLDYTEKDQFDVILMNPPYGGSEKDDVKNHFPSDLASSETADLFMSVIMYRLKKNGRAAVILPDGFLFGTDNVKGNIKKKLMSEFNLHTIIRMPSSVFSPYTSITTNILFFDHSGATKETWFYRLDMPEGYKHFSKTKPMRSEHFDPVREWWNNRVEIEDDDTDSYKAKCYSAEEIAENGYNLDLCGYPHEEEEILPPKELIQQYQEKRASLNAEIDRILGKISDILGIEEEGE
jgi:type I restriction enzyme M protein